MPKRARSLVNIRGVTVALLLAGLTAGGVSAAAPSVVGIAAAVVNDVRIKGAAARQFARAALRQRVALADQVQTGGASRLQLVLLDQSKFTVGANARLTIDRFVYDAKGSSMSASVAKGAFRFMSGRTSGTKSRTISSPAATIGIRGTLLDGAVGAEAIVIARGERGVRGVDRHDPASATLVVLRGPGPRVQGNDAPGAVDVIAGGETVTLDRPLEAAYVPYTGARPITFTLSAPGIALLNDMLLEPREVLTDPNAPGQPYMAQPQRERPRDRYDRPPPGGFDDGPGPGGGNYGPGAIPGVNGIPTNPGPRDRPNGRTAQPQTPNSTTGTLSTPTPTPSPAGRTANPAPSPSPSPQSMPMPTPTPTPTPPPRDPNRVIVN